MLYTVSNNDETKSFHPRKMNLSKIHHIAIIVSYYEAAKDFYVDKLGFSVIRETVVDHIVPHRGDQKLFWDKSNWQPLCKACHDRKTWREDNRPTYTY